MASRPARPPEIPGYAYVELIGQGGFADVFLYQQTRPARQVAVKVLLEDDPDAPERRRFDAEADVMAQLSSHPSIVSIFQADVASDGRAFLVMEYCPKPNLSVRCRQQPLSVPEALEIGVRISGAVETAHRAGILHRDIKPHNILVDAYDRPKLTDFGIAVAAGADAEAGGMSVPWSPPEMFADQPPNDPRSDVYSLGATVYTLLAGRSPFEVPGGNNDNHTLMTRIERTRPARPSRADVSDRLWETLLRSMSTAISGRHASAIAFARALQDAQIALHLTPTRIDVLDGSPEDPAAPADDESRTSIRPIAVIDQAPLVTRAPVGRPEPQPEPPGDDTTAYARRARTAPVAPVSAAEDTMARPPSGGTPPAPYPRETAAAEPRAAAPGPPGDSTVEPEDGGAPSGPGRRRVLAVVLAAVVVAGVVTTVLVLGDEPEEKAPSGLDDGPGVAVADVPPPPVMAAPEVRGGEGVFRWDNPDPRPGDVYRWRDADGDGQGQVVEEPRVRVPLGPDGSVCVLVQIQRGSALSSDVRACAPGGSS